jgi:rubredoxin
VERYKCEVCGYVYKPEQGGPKSEVEPETPFSELPSGWKCPVCGADSDQFFKLTEVKN